MEEQMPNRVSCKGIRYSFFYFQAMPVRATVAYAGVKLKYA